MHFFYLRHLAYFVYNFRRTIFHCLHHVHFTFFGAVFVASSTRHISISEKKQKYATEMNFISFFQNEPLVVIGVPRGKNRP